MKKNKFIKKNKEKNKKSSKFLRFNHSTFKDKRLTVAFGLFLIVLSLIIFLSLLSYIFSGKADQSIVESLTWENLWSSAQETKNWVGLVGALLSHFFIYQTFGLLTFLVSPLLLFCAFEIFGKSLIPLQKFFQSSLFIIVWSAIMMGYFVLMSETHTDLHFLCGSIGLRFATRLDSFLGWGTVLMLAFVLIIFLIYTLDYNLINSTSKFFPSHFTNKGNITTREKKTHEKPKNIKDELYEEDKPFTEEGLKLTTAERNSTYTEVEEELDSEVDPKSAKKETSFSITNLQIQTELEKHSTEEKNTTLMSRNAEVTHIDALSEDCGFYDPTLELSAFKAPTLEILKNSGDAKVKVTREELEENKDKIVETLLNFKIGISSIKATIGPTVTLYEIVPDAGIKVSKIKSLEDDIALSLAALGIRIIAPIPGKGTIGIEVPNKNREMVSMRSVLSTKNFVNADKDLPIAFGKTIANEVFVTDLAKMPHLLMAGSTGQGKSVGLNVILTSLLYKKHPAELKFVLVDPKKVELSLFSKIERHYLASLPDAKEAIVTDTKKAIYVLESLCTEMDNRYGLLKKAACRHIREYNKKFINRQLNPQNGHDYLPYIVLIIDELADLMMVAGKEVETPIARLAQLARAIGIHLIIATQRPSVNVITGIIKANFPARLSFRVISKIDSRTILDTSGAEQLVGMGDMLLSNGSEIIRLQCAFIDTDEVEYLCNYIGEQQGYPTAYMLPECEQENETKEGVDMSNKDEMFKEAARLVVTHQQGSTSLIQRRLSLGYNRAGRIMDQLEAVGIVGPSEGSKAREILVDEYGLEQLLNSLNDN